MLGVQATVAGRDKTRPVLRLLEQADAQSRGRGEADQKTQVVAMLVGGNEASRHSEARRRRGDDSAQPSGLGSGTVALALDARIRRCIDASRSEATIAA